MGVEVVEEAEEGQRQHLLAPGEGQAAAGGSEVVDGQGGEVRYE